jgi:hypothetical protein
VHGYDVVSPIPPAAGSGVARARPRGGPDGPRRVGFLWNFQFHGDEFFAAARAALEAEHGPLEFVGPEAYGNIHGHDEEDVLERLPELLLATEVDSVIVATGG